MDLAILIVIFKEELFAPERVPAVDGNENSNSDETDYFIWCNLLNNTRKADKKYEKNIKYDLTLKVYVYCSGKSQIQLLTAIQLPT